MATQYLPRNTRNELERLLGRWEARWRLRTVLLYLPRILMLSFGLGALATFVLAFSRLVNVNGLVTFVAVLVIGTIVGACAALSFFGKKGVQAALRFDALFGLQERLATAFELLEGRIKTVDELAELQLQDTLSRAQAIEPNKIIHLEWRRYEWLVAALMGVLLAVLLAIVVFFGKD
jgi:hypothetical protein